MRQRRGTQIATVAAIVLAFVLFLVALKGCGEPVGPGPNTTEETTYAQPTVQEHTEVTVLPPSGGPRL